jgi:hypothetical protein
MATKYDCVVIGAGISGLLCAYRLVNKGFKVIVFEADPVRVGGRAYDVEFEGVNVDLGAGVIREGDARLKHLLKELGISTVEFKSSANYKFDYFNVSKLETTLREKARKYRDEILEHRLTFREFLFNYFKPEHANKIIYQWGFTDQLETDVFDVLENYYISDIDYKEQRYASIIGGWNRLVNKLKSGLEVKHEAVRVVKKINDNSYKYRVIANITEIDTKCVVSAVDIGGFNKIQFVGVDTTAISSAVGGIEFVRIYAKCDESIDLLPEFAIVESPISKIIVIDRKHKVFMSVYADNQNAVYWKNMDDEKLKLCVNRHLARALNVDIPEIKSILKKYWDVGVHYYKPRSMAEDSDIRIMVHDLQRVDDGLFAIGEMLSTHHGWTEGAVESVDMTIKDIIKSIIHP